MKSLSASDRLAILHQLAGRFRPAARDKGDLMKKLPKKLKLAKETLLHLEAESLENVLGAATDRSVCVTICASNCTSCITNCPNTVCATC